MSSSHVKLSSKLTDDMTIFATKKGIHPEMVLLTAYVRVLSDILGANPMRVLVDFPCDGSEVIGPTALPFVLMLPADDIRSPSLANLAANVQARVGEKLTSYHDPDPGMTIPSAEWPHLAHAAFRFEEQTKELELLLLGADQTEFTVELVVKAGLGGRGEGADMGYHVEVHVDRDIVKMPADVILANMVLVTQNMIKPPADGCCLGSTVKLSTAITHNSNDDHARRLYRVPPQDGMEDVSSTARKEGTPWQQRHKPLPYLVVAVMQIIGFALLGIVVGLPILLVWPVLQSVLGRFDLMVAIAMSPLAYHAVGLIMCAEILLLRQLLRHDKPGEFPINSWPFLRWWLLRRVLSLTNPIYMDHIQGTWLHIWWLRALGCRIGDNARILRGASIVDPEMVLIGDDAVVGKAKLMGSIVRDGMVRRGMLSIGKGAYIGTHAVLLPNSHLGDQAVLKPLSVIQEGQILPGYGIYEGSPALFTLPRERFGHTTTIGITTMTGSVVSAIGQLVQLLLAPSLAALSAAFAYPIMGKMAQAAGIFPFIHWTAWKEGRLFLALSTSAGVVPFLMMPTLLADMKFQGSATFLPDKVLMSVANTLGYKVTPEVLHTLFTTEQGVEILRQHLPPGFEISGSPGPSLEFIATGRQVQLLMHSLLMDERRGY